MEFAGELETHLTVAPGDRAEGALATWAAGRGLGLLHIVLPRGRVPSQPMLTWRGTGGLSRAREAAAELARALAEDGFVVTRIKIEAALENEDIPRSDAEAAHHPERYFEHHVKLRLGPGVDLDRLAALAAGHGAHLSRNALRTHDDGHDERFLTQRCPRVGRARAHERLAALLQALAGHQILEVEEEFVVHDSNLALDDGWMVCAPAPEREP
jgi:hypothetical protein